MKYNALTTISSTMAISGCIIGAGFVGGKELQLSLGTSTSIVAPTLFGAVVGIIVFALLTLFARNNVYDIDSLSSYLLPRHSYLVQFFLTICYLAILTTMFATINSIVSEIALVNDNIPIFSFGSAVAVGLFSRKGNKGIIVLCNIAMPLVLLTIVVLSLFHTNTSEGTSDSTVIDSVNYAIFNCVMSLGIISGVAKKTTKKSRAHIAFAVAITVGIASMLVLRLVKNTPSNTITPILQVLGGNKILYYIAVVAILLSALTSVATCSCAVINWTDTFVSDKNLSTMMVMFVSLLLSLADIDVVLNYIYPLMTIFAVLLLAVPLVKVFIKREGRLD